MKRYITIFLTILLLSSTYFCILAQENQQVDISRFKFKMLTDSSDQNKDVIVSKYYDKTGNNKVAFCLESSEAFLPSKSTYYQSVNSNDEIYQIVKAYEQIGKEDDNYYIAAQILIWQHLDNQVYTFNLHDYKKYQDEILKQIELNRRILDFEYEEYVDNKYTIEYNFENYEIVNSDVEIINFNSGSLTYYLENRNLDNYYIKLSSKDKYDGYIYNSETSQDLYCFNGDYSDSKDIVINIKPLYKSEYIDIKFSKTDTENNPIKGAEFTLYIANNTTYENIVFIQTNKDINIYEAISFKDKEHNNLRIEISERYNKYIDDGIINTDEVGYFDCYVFEKDSLIYSGRFYVCDDSTITNNSYSKNKLQAIYKGYSDDLLINSINDIERNNTYYLCESKPLNGYTFTSNPCVLINGNSYMDEIYNFKNVKRTYSLKLIKESPEQILLDGAKFKITYIDDEGEHEKVFFTGGLTIQNENNNKYLVIKYEKDNSSFIYEFEDEYLCLNNCKEGKYYYYQTNTYEINENLFDNCAEVVKGGYIIENLPYSSVVKVEELIAPIGYVIEEPIYYIYPDIGYSEITLKNYRVNCIDVLPEKNYRIPKTCID